MSRRGGCVQARNAILSLLSAGRVLRFPFRLCSYTHLGRDPCDDLSTTDNLGREAEGAIESHIPTRILPTRRSPEYKFVGPSGLS